MAENSAQGKAPAIRFLVSIGLDESGKLHLGGNGMKNPMIANMLIDLAKANVLAMFVIDLPDPEERVPEARPSSIVRPGTF